MKVVVQRVSEARVEVGGKVVGAIGVGALVLLGVTHSDRREEAAWLSNKILHLRMFEDEGGKINQSLIDKQGSILVISQFTLYGDCKEGRRPSFTQAAPPEAARVLYEAFVEEMKKGGLPVETGIFGAEMKVWLMNDGPVTLIIEK